MRTHLYIFIVLLFIQSNTLADIRYVSKTGSNIPPYLSWETASDSIQKVINICNIGDTVLVANGIYYESIIIVKTITLLGSSADSTVIKGNGAANDIIKITGNNTWIDNINIVGPGIDLVDRTGIYLMKTNATVRNCKVTNIMLALCSFYSSPLIENVIVTKSNYHIWEECPGDTCHGIFRKNIFVSTGGMETPVWFGGGGSPTFNNNIIIGGGDIWTGVKSESLNRFTVKNNLIAGFKTEGISVGLHSDTAFIINNTLSNIGGSSFVKGAIQYVQGRITVSKNNIITHSAIGANSENEDTYLDYNLFWDVKQLTKFKAKLRDSNFVADPMFVNDTAVSSDNYDFHLQKYSPAIDKGDPSILDKDGTRSDIGMFGGPGGDEYTYLDLSPRAPVNLTATVYSDTIKLKWNKNTEADTSYYRVYRDTVQNFTLDSSKIIAAITDSFFTEREPIKAMHLYYKITAVDICNNESHPSEEIFVDPTSAGNEEPKTIISYNLYQNYPNPFNPSTIIPYRLKERGYVKLMVYDLKGELVRVLVNKEQEKGYYETRFDGNGLSSGIYLYRIEVIGNGRIPVFSDMKKMMFLK